MHLLSSRTLLSQEQAEVETEKKFMFQVNINNQFLMNDGDDVGENWSEISRVKVPCRQRDSNPVHAEAIAVPGYYTSLTAPRYWKLLKSNIW